MSMPMDVAIAVARNKLGPAAWVTEEWTIGHDDARRRWCMVGTQTDDYSRHIAGQGPTFEAALANATDRFPQRRGGR